MIAGLIGIIVVLTLLLITSFGVMRDQDKEILTMQDKLDWTEEDRDKWMYREAASDIKIYRLENRLRKYGLIEE